jgi:hypothetical protein
MASLGSAPLENVDWNPDSVRLILGYESKSADFGQLSQNFFGMGTLVGAW